MSTIIAIADAVAAALNAKEFSLPLAARRVYTIKGELENLQDLTVLVAGQGLDIEPATRGDSQCEYRINVGVLQKLTRADNAELDPLMALMEELADYCATIRLESPCAFAVGVENSPVYNPDHLDTHRQFTSVLTVTFRVLR